MKPWLGNFQYSYLSVKHAGIHHGLCKFPKSVLKPNSSTYIYYFLSHAALAGDDKVVFAKCLSLDAC